MKRAGCDDDPEELFGTLFVETQSADEVFDALWVHLLHSLSCRFRLCVATKHDTRLRWNGKRKMTRLLYFGLLRGDVRGRAITDAVLEIRSPSFWKRT